MTLPGVLLWFCKLILWVSFSSIWAPTKWHVHPVKTQIGLIRATTQPDQSLLCAQWVAKDPRFLHAGSEDSDQIRWCTGHFVGSVMLRLISDKNYMFPFVFYTNVIKQVYQHSRSFRQKNKPLITAWAKKMTLNNSSISPANDLILKHYLHKDLNLTKYECITFILFLLYTHLLKK